MGLAWLFVLIYLRFLGDTSILVTFCVRLPVQDIPAYMYWLFSKVPLQSSWMRGFTFVYLLLLVTNMSYIRISVLPLLLVKWKQNLVLDSDVDFIDLEPI